MLAIFLQVSLFLLFGILAFCFSNGLFFEQLYHSDNLYLPLFLEDVLIQNHAAWYLPPSNYFFPDGFLVLLVSTVLPLAILPVAYGMFNISLILISIFLFERKMHGLKKALFSLHSLCVFLTLSMFFSFLYPSHLSPMGLLFTSGHHTSIIYVSFLSLARYTYPNRKSTHLKNLGFLILLSAFYASDRFALILLLALYLCNRHPRKNQFSLRELTLVLVIGEGILYLLGGFFQFPNSFAFLKQSLVGKDLISICYLELNYYFDFIKIFLTKTPAFFLLSFLILIPFLIKNKRLIAKPHRGFLIWMCLLSLLFLGFVGRFVYPHPFPLRYIFPFLFLMFVFGISIATKKLALNQKSRRCSYLLFLVFYISIFFFTNQMLSAEYEDKYQRQVDIVLYLQNRFQGQVFWTSYEYEKKLRFFSQGRLRPLPLDKNGNAYPWITGAFSAAVKNLNFHDPKEGEPIWVPNSLTKDF
jgi:hypothetical protein